jgi:DNA repair protein RadC
MTEQTKGGTGMSTANSILEGKLKYRVPQIKLCLVQEGARLRKLYPIKTPVDAAKFFSPLRFAPEEHFVSLHLNARHEVIGLHEVSHGTVSSSLVHPREVFKAALLSNSYALIVCHNHPSGSRLFASKEDINTTEQLVKAAGVLGVNLLDHLIVSRNDAVYSIRENYPQLWD